MLPNNRTVSQKHRNTLHFIIFLRNTCDKFYYRISFTLHSIIDASGRLQQGSKVFVLSYM